MLNMHHSQGEGTVHQKLNEVSSMVKQLQGGSGRRLNDERSHASLDKILKELKDLCLKNDIIQQSDEKSKIRATFNDWQQNELNKAWNEDKTPPKDVILDLSQRIGSEKVRVGIWFRNKRHREKSSEDKLLSQYVDDDLENADISSSTVIVDFIDSL